MSNRTRNTLGALAVTAALALPMAAQADGATPVFGGFYGGVGGLYTDFDDRSNDSRTGYRLYGGFDVLRVPLLLRLGLEGGYSRTGSFETNGGTDRYSNTDLGLQATFTTIPLLDLHGRIGYEWGDSDGDYYALGGSLAVFPLTRVRGEYQFRNDFDAAMLSIEVRVP